MDWEQARFSLKVRLEEYLQAKGIDARRAFCCLNPAHVDRNPSMRYDPRRHKVHCFSCGADYDLFDLVAIDYGLSEHRDIFQKAYELYPIGVERHVGRAVVGGLGEPGVIPVLARDTGKSGLSLSTAEGSGSLPLPSVSAYLDEAFQCISRTSYPQLRGLTDRTIQRFRIGYDPAFRARTDDGNLAVWDAIILPTGPHSFLARNTDPGAQRRDRIRKTGGNPLFNVQALDDASGEAVFVVEGEIDALSVIEAGGACVGLGSTSNVRRLLAHLQGHVPAASLMLALDADERGREAQKELREGLVGLGIAFEEPDILCGAKDPNDALVSNRQGFIRAVAKAKAKAREHGHKDDGARNPVLESRASQYLDQFLEGSAGALDMPCLSTGFPGLDAQLDGGLYEGLYILGAVTSLGKTTFVLQMADQIAQAGRDVMIVSLEMGRNELMAKSISRHTLMGCKEAGLPACEALSMRRIASAARQGECTPQQLERLHDAVEAYGAYADHVYIHEGRGDVDAARVGEWVKAHAQVTGQAPVVVIDYLQILSPGDRFSDKQNMDRAVLELKRLSRDFRTPVVAVSSLNRQSYRGDVTLEAFKESGAIEYGSDVLLGLQFVNAGRADFDGTAERLRNPRRVEIRVLKNRNGVSGGKVGFAYYPAVNYFAEQ